MAEAAPPRSRGTPEERRDGAARPGSVSRPRPGWVTLVALLFALATVVAWISAVSLLAPGGPLEPMWRLNPDARAGFSSLGRWAPALLVLLGCATGAAAVGLWRLRRWGRWLAVSLLALDALGGVVRAIRDPRSALGLVVVAALLALLLSRRARAVLSR